MSIPLEDFKTAAASLSELVGDGHAVILISRPFSPFLVQFELSLKDEGVRTVVESSGLGEKGFQRTTKSVSRALTALVESHGPEVLARQENESSEKQAIGETEIADAKKKLEVVSERFNVEMLRTRAWLKKTTKHDILLDRSWEVARKEADSDAECPMDGTLPPMGVLRLSSASLKSPIAFVTGEGINDLVATVDRQDVRSLIRTLEKLDAALSDAVDTKARDD